MRRLHPRDDEGTHRRRRREGARTTELRLARDQVHVTGRTSSGGIDFTVRGPTKKATWDSYVSHELEVNVDALLTPAIDELNTEGPLGIRCDVTKETR